MSKALLPVGCYDVLPPYARQESELSAILLSTFESFGYEQVSPPLLEYSDSLLAGRGASLSPQIFRVMDPSAHKMMGLRADMTLQIARIAINRMQESPRPLRLCYNGVILRMQGEQLKGDRQLHQAGIELIGANSPETDAEVILVAAEALKRTGINKISIDLNLPSIVSTLLTEEKLDNEQIQNLLAAIAQKDQSAVKTFSFKHRDTMIALMQGAGAADKALAAMEKLAMPESARREFQNLKEVLRILGASQNPDWTLTVDATEQRGFSYHTGISFSIFVPGAACEVGRGGRYRIENASNTLDSEATGFTLYEETLRSLLPEPTRGKRIFIPEGILNQHTADLRAQGYITIYALSEYGIDEEEAKRLGCGYIYKNGKVKEL